MQLEFKYWKDDQLSIAVILCAQAVLWSVNVSWACGMMPAVSAMAATVCVRLALGQLTDPHAFHDRKVAFTREYLIKLLFGFQFLCTGYVGRFSIFETEECGFFASIWAVYLPGFVAFVAKKRFAKSGSGGPALFGLHEVFHVFVYAGHVTTMGIDLYITGTGLSCTVLR